MPLIYIVEDDEDINELLVYNLKKEGFQVKPFLESKKALESLTSDFPDLILLDIMLPDIDGLEFCKRVKSDTKLSKIPIIMLTAKSTEIDKIVGLELGADDYITKPFSFRELIARIKAVLRRAERCKEESSTVLKENDLKIYPDKFEIFISDKKVDLTKKEFQLLMALIKNKGKVLSREYLLENIWKDELNVFDRTIDVHIKKLRDKLERYGEKIKTVRGVGYKWED